MLQTERVCTCVNYVCQDELLNTVKYEAVRDVFCM